MMRRILVGYDGTPAARRALDTAAEMAGAFGATISVVSVVPGTPDLALGDDLIAAHAAELVEAQRLLRECGIEPALLEPIGDPAGTIERIAEEGDFDAVVVGARGLGPIERAFRASVSDHVANHARTTVVVAR